MISLFAVLAIGCGAILGALLRWFFGIFLNPLFPTLPLGTLTANLFGGLLMGVFMALTKDRFFFPEVAKLGMTTGFLGSLTTFSTFSAETITLISNGAFLWSLLIIIAHVLGTLFFTFLGITLVKLLTQ